MLAITRRTAKILAAAVVPASLLIAGATVAAAASNQGAAGARRHHSSHFEVRPILSRKALSHTFTPAGSSMSRSQPLTQPDDITALGHDLFVGFHSLTDDPSPGRIRRGWRVVTDPARAAERISLTATGQRSSASRPRQ